MSSRTFTIYRLHFTTPLHLSNTRDDYGVSRTSMSSDSLYAALTASLAKQAIAIPDNGDLGCLVSDLFPFYQKSAEAVPTLYFPKPLSINLKGLDPSEIKQYKKIKWLDKTCFEKAIAGNFQSCVSCGHVNGDFFTIEDYCKDFITSSVSERATISRTGKDSMPFYMDRVSFRDYSGLFFIAEGNTDLIDKAIPLLSAEGIGTDRNVGNGYFDFDKSQVNITVPDSSSAGMLLSSFIPETPESLEELTTGETTAYEIIRLGGWITSPPYLGIRKNAIYALSSGSVLSSPTSGIGRIVNLAPAGLCNHPIWRCGKSIVLPICQ